MDFDTIADQILLKNEEAILWLPDEKKLDFLEYLLDHRREIIDDIVEYAWYLKPYLTLLNAVRSTNAKKEKILKIAENDCYCSNSVISNILKYESKYAEMLVEYIDSILSIDISYINDYIDYAMKKNRKEIIEKLINSENLTIRAKTIMHLVAKHYEYYKKHYSHNFEDYFMLDGKLIREEYASLIVSYLAVHDTKEYYRVLKFVLENYKENTILSHMTSDSLDYHLYHEKKTGAGAIEEAQAIKDINILFNSYSGNKYIMFERYGRYLDEETKRRYSLLKNFYNADLNAVIEMFSSTLYNHFLDVVEKYSQGITGAIKVAGRGTRSTAYVVGDKIIKCSNGKWNQKRTTSISSFLILKNLEEYYEYDQFDGISHSIEVQPYLKRKAYVFSRDIIKKFKEEFARQGLECSDLLIRNFISYQNIRYLNDYHDANCDDPESLPEWFKENPIVLIDSDMVKRKK